MQETRRPSWQAASALALVAALGLLYWAWQWGPLRSLVQPDEVKAAAERIADAPWAPLAAIGVIAVVGLLAMPFTPFVIVCAMVFGFAHGVAYSYLGSLLASVVGYVLGRWFGPALLAWIRSPKIARLETLLRQRGFVAVLLVRFMPVGHLVLESLVAGFVRIGYVPFVVATMIGILPETVVVSLCGGELTQLLTRRPSPAVVAVVVMAVVAAVSVWLVWRRRRRPQSRSQG